MLGVCQFMFPIHIHVYIYFNIPVNVYIYKCIWGGINIPVLEYFSSRVGLSCGFVNVLCYLSIIFQQLFIQIIFPNVEML